MKIYYEIVYYRDIDNRYIDNIDNWYIDISIIRNAVINNSFISFLPGKFALVSIKIELSSVDFHFM